MKIVFFGTPDYVLPILDTLQKKFRDKLGLEGIVAVVTQKPRPSGRNQFLTYSAVDAWAHKRKIPIIYDLSKVPPADIGILAAFGEIIPEPLISSFKFGIINIHPSLLPKYRGASPIQAAIAAGEEKTGVSIIKLDKELDHGAVVTQFTEGISEDDTLGGLRVRLFERAAAVLGPLIPAYTQGKIKLKKQDHDSATFTTLVLKSHGFIPPKYLARALAGKGFRASWEIPFIKDFSLSPNPKNINNVIRALSPWPGAWTEINLGKELKRLKILRAHLEKEKLILDEVQLEGKNPVSWEEFTKGYPKAILE